MLKERVRSRKQKPGESFTAFYDDVLSLMDRVAIKIDEEELLEILKNNLLPVHRHKLLFEVIESVGHLRRLVQMNENLIKELRSNSTDIAKPRLPASRQQVYALEEALSDADSNPELDPAGEVAALRQAGPKNMDCWILVPMSHVLVLALPVKISSLFQNVSRSSRMFKQRMARVMR
ncbi:hypothetical protein ACLKA7_002334 [Drosophila subpalustris]